MNFSRINENTIRCVLTSEDLEEYGLNLEDFFRNSEQAKEFLQKIVERAKEEVGYDFEGGALAMQVAPLPKDGLLITFSEKTDSFLKGLSEHLKDLLVADGMPEVEADSPEVLSGEQGNLLEGFLKSLFDDKDDTKASEKISQKVQTKKKEKKAEVSSMPEMLMYAFSSLNVLEMFVQVAQSTRFLKSSLYYLPEMNVWYLTVWRGRTSAKLWKSFCAQALEYGTLVSDSSTSVTHLKEHGQCIFEKDAVKQLKALL